MRKGFVWPLSVILCLFLSSCRAGTEGKETQRAAETVRAESMAEPESGENLGGSDLGAGKENLASVSGYQIVSGYGICAPGSPALYELGSASRTAVETDGASARLLYAVYQDSVLVVGVEVTDRSVTAIPAGEVKTLLEKEKENQEKEERGEDVQWDDSYFCIDEKNQVYGRSAFGSRVKASAQGSGRPAGGRVYGGGTAADGFFFNSVGVRYDCADFAERGTVTALCELTISDKVFETEEPDGIYELYLDGFADPLRFTLVRAPEYESLEGIEGLIAADGFYALAEGAFTEDGLEVTCYTYSDRGLRMAPYQEEKPSLTFLTVDGQEIDCVLRMDGRVRGKEPLSGVSGKGTFRCTAPFPYKQKIKAATLEIPAFSLESQEEAGEVRIPIPDGNEPMDETVKFEDCVIRLTGVRRTPEKQTVGTNEEGRKIRKPVLYVTAYAERGTYDKILYAVGGREAGKEQTLYADMLVGDFQKDKDGNPLLKGFRVSYDEGEEAAGIIFQTPYYLWKRNFELPVQF